MQSSFRRAAIAVALASIPTMLFGHHSFPAFYNTSQVAEVLGQVVAVQWENPHVQFSIQTETGELWEIESNSIRGLQRAELSQSLIAVDTRLKVAGFPALNGETKMYSSNLLLPDGREIVLRPGSERRWTTEQSSD